MSLSQILTGIVPHGDLYNQALSSAYNHFFRLIDPDYALQQDVDSWRKIWRDPKIAQAMLQRTATAAGKDWSILPATEAVDELHSLAVRITTDALKKIRSFTESRSLLMNSIFHATAYAFPEGSRQWMNLGGVEANWWVPRKLKHVDKKRFQIVPTHLSDEPGEPEIVSTRIEMWHISRLVYVPITQERFQRFTRMIYNDEEGRLGYGRGLMESIYFLWWVKQELIKEGLSGIEKWARGIIGAKVDLQQQAGDSDTETSKIRNEFVDAIEKMQSRHVIVMDKQDELIISEGGGGKGSDMVMQFMKYADDCLMGVIMGSVLPFGGSGKDTGSLARARVEEDTSDILLVQDREKLGECLTDGVVDFFWKSNQPQLSALGLNANEHMPRFDIAQQRHEDPEANAPVIVQALGAGVSLKKSQVYEKLGFDMPEEGDDVFEGGASGIGAGAADDLGRGLMDLFGRKREEPTNGKQAGGGQTDRVGAASEASLTK